ncbi:MAG: Flp family type IVb pilin [Kiritimatiellae bacterium]|nr:Flp family type IVb pilin [Kiritimatiellia bacterium]
MKKSKKGQTMVEYIIIVALIAISLIAVFTYFGKATGKKVAGAAEAISDSEGSKAQQAVDSIEDPEDPKSIKQLGE